jgi:TrmH family RNA methyltransferase
LISSRSNARIKFVRSLRQRKARQAEGLAVVEGIHPVGEAIEARAAVRSIFYAPDLLTSDFARDLIRSQEAAGIECLACSADVFTSIAERDHPQGLLALVAVQETRLEQLHPANFSWGVALVAPQDPGNVGAILRTVDAAGASGVLLLDSSVDSRHPTLVRASMGALFWHPLAVASFQEFRHWAHSYDYDVIGTSAQGEVDYRQVADYRRPVVLLMGSEREGLSAEHRQACTQVVRLPMAGHATSLNLAIATGIMLYAMLERLQPQSI